MFRINKSNDDPVVEEGPIVGGSQMDVEYGETPASKRPKVRTSGEADSLRLVVEHPPSRAKEIMNIFFTEIMKMKTSEKNIDQFIDLSTKLLTAHKAMILQSFDEHPSENIVNIVKEASKDLINGLKQISSSAKRINECRKKSTFVEPHQHSIKLKWKTKMPAGASMPIDEIEQSTFQYVPISETLKSAFSQPEFKKMFMQYNSVGKHVCQDGVYYDFCCGSTFKSHEIFKEPNVIQIQLGR